MGLLLRRSKATERLVGGDERLRSAAVPPFRDRGALARVPAIVVGGAGACGLGVVRSLARGGVPTILLDSDRMSPAMHSRFGRKLVVSRLSGPVLIQDLLRLGQTFLERPVLFLTSDEAALTVSEYRKDLTGRYRIRLPNHATLTSLMHKTSFQRRAEAYGFPVPRSITIKSLTDLHLIGQLNFPCIIKPTLKNADYVKSGLERAYRVESRAQAESAVRRVLPVAPNLVVQEWIPGRDSDIYFCLQYRSASGETVSSFTGRKLRIWPPDVGITASCTAAPEARAILQPLTEAFFDCASFVGMGSIEYKRDARTGRFLMIEPTVGRVDWQEEVATLHGVNIPLAAYLHEAGARIPRAEDAAPIIWRDCWIDWRSPRGRGPDRAPVPAWRVYDAYWRLDDPMPALYRGVGGLIRSSVKHARRIDTAPRS